MLTKTKTVFVYTGRKTLEEWFSRFEGLSVSDGTSQSIETIWRNNKTPVVREKYRPNITVDHVLIPSKYTKNRNVKTFQKWAEKNGVDTGEYLEGDKVDTREEVCVLCDIAHKKGTSTRIYNKNVEEQDRIIYESPNFYVVPELGSIKQGFLMICPKKHEALSIAQLDPNLVPEYKQVLRDVEELLKASFNPKGKVTFFEHGSNPSGLSSHKKSIVHAHVHAVIDFKMNKKYLKQVQVKPCKDIYEASDTHYFAYKEGAEGQILLCKDREVYVPRQYPRKVMAKQLGLPDSLSNWRTKTWSENITVTLYRIFKAIQNNIVSERILQRTSAFYEAYDELTESD